MVLWQQRALEVLIFVLVIAWLCYGDDLDSKKLPQNLDPTDSPKDLPANERKSTKRVWFRVDRPYPARPKPIIQSTKLPLEIGMHNSVVKFPGGAGEENTELVSNSTKSMMPPAFKDEPKGKGRNNVHIETETEATNDTPLTTPSSLTSSVTFGHKHGTVSRGVNLETTKDIPKKWFHDVLTLATTLPTKTSPRQANETAAWSSETVNVSPEAKKAPAKKPSSAAGITTSGTTVYRMWNPTRVKPIAMGQQTAPASSTKVTQPPIQAMIPAERTGTPVSIQVSSEYLAMNSTLLREIAAGQKLTLTTPRVNITGPSLDSTPPVEAAMLPPTTTGRQFANYTESNSTPVSTLATTQQISTSIAQLVLPNILPETLNALVNLTQENTRQHLIPLDRRSRTRPQSVGYTDRGSTPLRSTAALQHVVSTAPTRVTVLATETVTAPRRTVHVPSETVTTPAEIVTSPPESVTSPLETTTTQRRSTVTLVQPTPLFDAHSAIHIETTEWERADNQHHTELPTTSPHTIICTEHLNSESDLMTDEVATESVTESTQPDIFESQRPLHVSARLWKVTTSPRKVTGAIKEVTTATTKIITTPREVTATPSEITTTREVTTIPIEVTATTRKITTTSREQTTMLSKLTVIKTETVGVTKTITPTEATTASTESTTAGKTLKYSSQNPAGFRTSATIQEATTKAPWKEPTADIWLGIELTKAILAKSPTDQTAGNQILGTTPPVFIEIESASPSYATLTPSTTNSSSTNETRKSTTLQPTTTAVDSATSAFQNTNPPSVVSSKKQKVTQKTEAPNVKPILPDDDVIVNIFDEIDTTDNEVPKRGKHILDGYGDDEVDTDKRRRSKEHNIIYHYYRGHQIINYHFYGNNRGTFHHMYKDDNRGDSQKNQHGHNKIKYWGEK